jgi:autotransporter-associated beta strand protein
MLTLNKTGDGTVVLDAVNSYCGSTVVSDGTLVIASASAFPDGGSLFVGAGGTFILGDGSGQMTSSGNIENRAATTVPEPGSMALLLAAAALALVATGLRNCRRRRNIAN